MESRTLLKFVVVVATLIVLANGQTESPLDMGADEAANNPTTEPTASMHTVPARPDPASGRGQPGGAGHGGASQGSTGQGGAGHGGGANDGIGNVAGAASSAAIGNASQKHPCLFCVLVYLLFGVVTVTYLINP